MTDHPMPPSPVSDAPTVEKDLTLRLARALSRNDATLLQLNIPIANVIVNDVFTRIDHVPTAHSTVLRLARSRPSAMLIRAQRIRATLRGLDERMRRAAASSQYRRDPIPWEDLHDEQD